MTHPLEDENCRLREALTQLIYEITHLSPQEEDGSHRCRISARALSLARAALAAEPASGEAKDRAQDAMKAQVYPNLWPGPPLGQTAPPPRLIYTAEIHGTTIKVADGTYTFRSPINPPTQGETLLPDHGTFKYEDGREMPVKAGDTITLEGMTSPTGEEEETALNLTADIANAWGVSFQTTAETDEGIVSMIQSALRQRADEATRAEREAIASEIEDIMPELAAIIRARITPKA